MALDPVQHGARFYTMPRPMPPDTRAKVAVWAGIPLLFLLSAAILISCMGGTRARTHDPAPGPGRQGPLMRVHLSGGGKEQRIRIPSPWTAKDFSGRILAQGSSLEGPVVRDGEGFRIGVQHLHAERLRLSAAAGAVEVNGVPYVGELVLQRSSIGAPQILNLVPLERYLAGLLGCEVPLDWPEETLKAQIVAARTYALVRREQSASEPYDLTDGTQDQCYQGLLKERPLSRRLAEETAGTVATYGRKPFITFYSAVCGGHTAQGPNALREKSPWIAPLLGRPCPYCEKGLPPEKQGRYRWERSLPRTELEKALKIPGTLQSVEPLFPDGGGHSGLVRLSWSPAGSREVLMTDFRAAAGISSNTWTASVASDAVRFTGRGFGHGTGLCQCGAKRMGEEGFDHREILRFYYPGSELVRLY